MKPIDLNAAKLADLTFTLLADCEQKELKISSQHGLTHAEFRCLRIFGESQGVNNKHIANKMNLSASRLTRIIDGLEKKGYVARSLNQDDRRNLRLSITDKGNILIRELNSSYLNMHKKILSNIPESKHEAVIDAMESFSVAIKKWLEQEL